jgi:hypothetical protein
MSHLYDQSPLGKGFSGDLFGRLKVSEPLTLFDSTHRYSQGGDFDDVIIGSGSTVGIITNQSTATLTIGSTAGCSLIRESKRVFSYQPGKSLQVFQTFVLNPPKQNLTQRVGYASSENGIMLELVGSQVNIIKRTAISGVSTTITVPQSQWNQDKLDGTGVSGYTLDLTKAQILFTEYEWLGVGSVRVGFAIDGKFIPAHVFNHANTLDSVYMTTASLPIRYELLNTGNVGSASTMKQICVSVQSNGGYEKTVAPNVARRETFKVGIGTTATFTPLVSIKLNPGREDAIVLPNQINVIVSSQQESAWEVVLLKNATLTGAAFKASDSPNVEYDISATGLSGGIIFRNDYITSANKAFVALNQEEKYNFDLQLGRTQSKVSDIYTLAIKKLSGADANIIGSLSFYDLT